MLIKKILLFKIWQIYIKQQQQKGHSTNKSKKNRGFKKKIFHSNKFLFKKKEKGTYF